MGKDSKPYRKKKISNKPIKKERNNSPSKDIDLDIHGTRVGYHSEAAKMPKYEEGGEEIGYHSEAAKMPKYEEGEGMNIGYHSEAANISSHRNRLHDNNDSLTKQQVDDDTAVSDQ